MSTGFVEFRKLLEVGVFSYLVTSCLKCHEMVFGSCEAGMTEHFSPKKKADYMLEVGIALGRSTVGHGAVLHSPEI